MSNSQIAFLIYWFFALAISAVLGLIWIASPLGIGFQGQPNSHFLRAVAQSLYFVSYFAGIPALLGSQIAALIMGLTGNIRIAYRLSLGSLIGFFVLIVIVGSFFG